LFCHNSAVTAHSSYFQNADVQNFLIGMIGQQQQQQSFNDVRNRAGGGVPADDPTEHPSNGNVSTPSPDLSPAFAG
jgi:hypothetical protein